jgi:heat shock protein HslJ
MRALRFAVLVAALALATTAAQAQNQFGYGRKKEEAPKGPAPKQEKQFPFGASWTLVSLNGKTFSGERPSFILDQQYRIKGFGGCNTFSATAYALREQRFAVGPLALTKKACDKGVMASEQAFFMALRTAALWDLAGPNLVIKGQNGELKLERSL